MYGVELWEHRERVYSIVLSWLLNSVSKGLLSGIPFCSRAFDVWTDLKKGLIEQMVREPIACPNIMSMQLGIALVFEYYTRLQTMWDEFEILVPAPCCNCEISNGFVTHMNMQKLYQFLMGLNESYQQARSKILMFDPLPTISNVHCMIFGVECQKLW